jgi:hypothetical protein
LRGAGVEEAGELAALLDWLRGERGPVGAVREVRLPPCPGEPGGAVGALGVAFGAGGAAGTRVRSLSGWLRTRRPSLKVTVIDGARSTANEASEVRDGDVLSLLREVLGAGFGL